MKDIHTQKLLEPSTAIVAASKVNGTTVTSMVTLQTGGIKDGEVGMSGIKEVIRVLGFIQEYFDNHANEQEPNERKELFVDWSDTVLEVITLLKAQEARVIKVAKYDDEIKSPEMDCFTWIEERGREDVYIGTVNRTSHMNYGEEIYCFIRFWGKSKDGIKFEDYNKTWRCWTSRPTDAQREATPWE